MGNIVSVRTTFPLSSVCSAANSELQDIWVYSAIEVPESFNPRAARQRWYRYYLSKAGQDRQMMEAVAHEFEGVHDFSGYARKDKRNPMRKIDSIEIADIGMFYSIDFRAESFLWNMVRRIVWMINEGSLGRIPAGAIGPGSHKKPSRVGLAPPEYLVLMDIDCGIEFPVDARASIGLIRTLERRIRNSGMRLAFEQDVARLVSTGTSR